MSKKNTPKPKIVFLDAGTVDYGDLSLKPLDALGEFRVHYATQPHEIAGRLADADLVVNNKCKLTREILQEAKQLKGIFLSATGTDNVDSQAAKDLGIAVANVPGYSTATMVQSTIGFLLALAGNLIKYNQSVHHGNWSKSPFFVYGAFSIREISGKKLGILGYGSIGQGVARAAKALGMEVLISKVPGRKYPKTDKVKRLPFDTVLKQSDFVSIHAPLTPLTRGLFSAETIRKMKKGSFLINTARGGIIEEPALLEALKSGHLAGAAADVLSQEPPPLDHILLGAPNMILTPHAAWASLESRTRVVNEVALNIQSFLQGKKRNRIV